MSNRPSYRELDRKIKAAKTALKTQNGYYANQNKAVGELNELGITSPNQIWELILKLLDEISPNDYKGKRPPEPSYEKVIKKKELFAFCWNSSKLREKMYIKFALDENRYYYVSLHKSKDQL
ncbi:MAG: hypothetical protein K1060chlam4_00109 [Candidatus Anoxychlamydiales bacterium]|nr:hypothetical protein [Candidatus Anoxychlamydiales bacterium]